MHHDICFTELDSKYIHGNAADLVKRLLAKDRTERLGSKHGIKEIKEHPYFEDLNWKDVRKLKHKYQKQYLKIDLTQSNFEYTGEDKYDIGIDVVLEARDDSGRPELFASADINPIY